MSERLGREAFTGWSGWSMGPLSSICRSFTSSLYFSGC